MLSRCSIVRRLGAPVVALALLTACTTSLTLDNVNLQSQIAQWLQDNYGQTASVSCPDDRPLQEGDTFQCQAVTTDELTFVFDVTQTDSNGHVSFRIHGAA